MRTSNRKKFDSLHIAMKSTGHWGKKTYLQPSVNWTYHLYGALIPTLKILLYINTLSFYEFILLYYLYLQQLIHVLALG